MESFFKKQENHFFLTDLYSCPSLAFEKQVKTDFRMEFPFHLFNYNEVGHLNYSHHIWTLAGQKRTMCSGVNIWVHARDFWSWMCRYDVRQSMEHRSLNQRQTFSLHVLGLALRHCMPVMLKNLPTFPYSHSQWM